MRSPSVTTLSHSIKKAKEKTIKAIPRFWTMALTFPILAIVVAGLWARTMPTQAKTANQARQSSPTPNRPTVPPKAADVGEYVGEIRAFAGESCPANWLPADGSELPEQGHLALSNAISDLWGTTQAHHFRLPDLRGVFLRGWNKERDKDGDPDARSRSIPAGAPVNPNNLGNQVGTYQQDQLLNHSHTLTLSSRWGDKYSSTTGFSNDDGQFSGSVSQGTSGTGGAETRPRNVYVLYCIRDGN